MAFKGEIMSDFNQVGKRVVKFGELGNRESEKPSYEMISYIDYIKREAGERGLIEKMGQMVDAKTGKVDRGQVCEQAILGRCEIKRNERVPVPINRMAKSYQKSKAELFDFARWHQPSGKEKAKENISEEVELMIKTKLKERGFNNISSVRFYTAVGTP